MTKSKIIFWGSAVQPTSLLCWAPTMPQVKCGYSSDKKHLINLVYLLKPTGAKIYVSKSPTKNRENGVTKINAMISGLNVPEATIVDQSDVTVDMLTDGIHPNETGYQIIACNFMKASGLKPIVSPPKSISRPKSQPRARNAQVEIPWFYPTSPDPGEPCEETVPEDTVFACGSSITPLRQEKFDPYGDGCDKNADGTVTCYRAENFDVSLDLHPKLILEF